VKLDWLIGLDDVATVKALVAKHWEHPFVQERYRCNVRHEKPVIDEASFWKQMVVCLLTTRNRSGPDSPVSRFSNQQPFPLSYDRCVGAGDVVALVESALAEQGGVWRARVIADQVDDNLTRLKAGLLEDSMTRLEYLRTHQDQATERETADFVDDNFVGFGAKQARNLLQNLGLTRHEIPLDSRAMRWLGRFGLPVPLSPELLSERGYYCFVLDAVQILCRTCDVLPCILDAAIFVEQDKGKQTAEVLDKSHST
jgi:hypothetical protein